MFIWDQYSLRFPDREQNKIGDYKDFIKWHAFPVNGLLDPKKRQANILTIDNFRQSFHEGWLRRNHQLVLSRIVAFDKATWS
jgi:hypothetical protein